MTKQEWLEEKLFVDLYGREHNLSDVPMTYMSREEAFLLTILVLSFYFPFLI